MADHVELAAVAIVGDFDPGRRNHQLTVAALSHSPEVRVDWLATGEVSADRLDAYNGLVLATGEYRSSEGALRAIRFARERGVPLVGT